MKSMKRFSQLFVAACASTVLAGCAALGIGDNPASQATQKTEKIKVVASFYPMADFAKKIGGDRVDVVTLVPTGTEPHDWEPSVDDMKTMSDAQVFVYNGAGMEGWAADVISSAGNDQLVSVEASKGVELLAADAEHEHEHEDEHDHDHEHEGEAEEEHADEHDHDHGAYDPHVWLNPANALIEMQNIAEALTKVDPEGKETYEKNLEAMTEQIHALDKMYSSELANVSSTDLVVSHQAFGYLCAAYGLNQMPISGIEADSEPDAKTMAELVDFVKEHKVKYIFSEELVSPKVAQAIADATGAQVEELSPLEGLSEEQLKAGEDYFSIMKKNLEKLKVALS